MGTPEQKARRQKYLADAQSIVDAMSGGQIKSDQDLQNFLASQGQNPTGPLYKQYYSQGGYSTYGPSWDPGWNFDFEHNQKIPYMGPGETWYDPSVASNWQNTDPLQVARINGYYNWRNSPEGIAAGNAYGGNNIAAWYNMRANSSMPGSPDMSWTGKNYVSDEGSYAPQFTNGFNPGGTSTSAMGSSIPGRNFLFQGYNPQDTTLGGILGNSLFQGMMKQFGNSSNVLGLRNGGAASGYVDPSWYR